MANLRWGYAINQWRNMEMDLVRKEQIESALKVISVCGFEAIEITDTAIGGPEAIEGVFGSAHGFMDLLKSCRIDRVCSFFSGLGAGSAVLGGGSATNCADHGRIIESAGRLADLLAELGARCLIVRPMGPYCREVPVTEDKIKAAAECWSNVGKITKAAGIQTAVHPDFLCGTRNADEIEKLLQWSDPETVALAMDTADFTIAGIDPVAFYENHHSRVQHLHFKDAVTTDTLNEYKEPNAELDYWPTSLVVAGQKRGIEHWYFEMGTPGGLVDFPALIRALHRHEYAPGVFVQIAFASHCAAPVVHSSTSVQIEASPTGSR